MRTVIGDVLPLAIVVTVSPINIVAAILLLFSTRPLRNATSYLAGFVVGVAAVLAGLSALASAADLTLSIMEAKDGRFYWTDPDQPTDTAFLLSDLPDDRHVTVDGHTSSPVFADDHESLVLDGLKLGLVDEESAIEQLPFQNKSVLLARLKAKQATQAKLMDTLKKEDPEGFTKVLEHQIGGGKKR